MKDTIKLMAKYLFYGISLGCTSFVVMCWSFYLGGGDAVLDGIFKDFARQSAGAVLVGVACGGTAVVYQFNRLSGLVKVIIHFCVGMGVFYPVAISLGWIPYFPGKIVRTVVQFLISCCIFMAIWFVFYLFNRNEAKRINERLKEMERDKENNLSKL